MKKLDFHILGFCLIPFYLLRNIKLFPSHPQSFEIGTLLLSTTTACATTRTADHQHRPETTTTAVRLHRHHTKRHYEVAHYKGASQ